MSANPHNASTGLDSESTAEATGVLSPASRPAAPSVSHAPGHEALQALLAFSSLHEQIRQRRARERRGDPPDAADVWELEQFVLDEVLHLVAERALTLTGADGVAIALAEGDAIVCRASTGSIAPEAGARLDPKSGFSGACLRTGGIVRCDDSENDSRVNVEVCRRLGTRSIVAVPIASAHGTIGLLEAFSAEAYGFNDSDVRSLNLLAELILSAMKPEEENRLAEISQRVVAGEVAEGPTHTAQNVADAAPTEVSENGEKPAIDESEVAAPDVAPAMFREYAEAPKPRRGPFILLLLAALALALGIGLWWKFYRRAPATPQTHAAVAVAAPISSPLEEQQAAMPQTVNGPGPASGSSSDSSSKTDAKASMRPLVTGIWHVSSADSTTVYIDLQGEAQYEAHRLSDPERIYFDLHDTALAPGLFGKTIEVGDPRLARVRIAQPRKGVSRVVLETTGASDFSVSVQANPYRLVVQIRKAAKPESGPTADQHPTETRTAVTPQPSPAAPAPAPAANRTNGQVRTQVAKFRLVLDAGHGGWDLGTVGRKGLMEKDLVLDIVGRLGKLVESHLGAEVIYTRQDDTYLPLEKRTEIANVAQADMFVSVHANYSNDSSARGAETYYTNTYSSVRARTPGADTDVTAPENINWTNVDIREKVQQSRRFAIAVQHALYGMLASQIPGMRNRGIKEASYVVLTGTSMPAVLAEVSFVSSPADETKLQSSNYRQKIAEALYKGIAHYAATSHRVNIASVPSKPKGL
jgi:N-acetylmuramoyl-L-alanine amidase